MRTESQTDKLTSSAEVIARAQEGDSQAFAALFEAHKPRIYAICLRMTNNMAEAEDLTQDAFIHVFRKLSTFRGESAFSTWLYRIAVNTVLMHFRKKSNRQVSLDQPAQRDSGLPKREYGRIDDRLTGSVDRLALARAINELPPGYRTIFLMHEVQGYEHQEIARLLHCSIGNSKSQLHKAKLRMRRLLAPEVQAHEYADARINATRSTAREVRASAQPQVTGDGDVRSVSASGQVTLSEKAFREFKKLQNRSREKQLEYASGAGVPYRGSRKSNRDVRDNSQEIPLTSIPGGNEPVIMGTAS